MGKEVCPICGRKIGRLARMKRKLMFEASKMNPQAFKEFKERQNWCPTCLALFFADRFDESVKKLDEAVWERLDMTERKLLEKAKKQIKKLRRKKWK